MINTTKVNYFNKKNDLSNLYLLIKDLCNKRYTDFYKKRVSIIMHVIKKETQSSIILGILIY